MIYRFAIFEQYFRIDKTQIDNMSIRLETNMFLSRTEIKAKCNMKDTKKTSKLNPNISKNFMNFQKIITIDYIHSDFKLILNLAPIFIRVLEV